MGGKIKKNKGKVTEVKKKVVFLHPQTKQGSVVQFG